MPLVRVSDLQAIRVWQKLMLQHVFLVRRYSHRYVMSLSFIISGSLAGIFGFCDHAWQILALRGLVSPVHLGGYVATIALGEIVDDEARGEGRSRDTERGGG